MLAFLAQDTQTRVFCYANAELRQDQRDDEILRFVDFWKRRTGHLPEELIFDSKLTTYAKLSELNRKGIQFITLRRRSQKETAGRTAGVVAAPPRDTATSDDFVSHTSNVPVFSRPLSVARRVPVPSGVPGSAGTTPRTRTQPVAPVPPRTNSLRGEIQPSS